MDIKELIQKAEDSGSYFLTLTTRDKTKDENNLDHYVIRQDFATADIIGSLDASVRSMGIIPQKPEDVIVPPKVIEDKKPLKIAIISHFNRMPASYSPARAVRNQVKILVSHGHEVVFFTMEGSKLTKEDLGCEVRPIVPAFKREKMVINEDAKKRMIDMLREQLTADFDIAITHDFYLQDTITYSEAIKECGVNIEWLHFARSGIAHSMDFDMPNARYVYLNKTDAGNFARSIKVPVEKVRSVYNEKEPAFMFSWSPITKMIVDKYELWNRDVIQTYPMCTTRMAAKGLSDVINTFVELKRLGNKVALIVANSNGRRRVDDLKREIENAKKLGLNEDELIFTSLLSSDEFKTESEVPNKVCAELMQLSNLFIFPTRAEVGPNVLLEASMTKNLIVINNDLKSLYDFADKESVLSYPFTSNKSLHYSNRDVESYEKLAKQIHGQIHSNKPDKQFRFIWRAHNSYSIYHDMLKPVLYEKIKE